MKVRALIVAGLLLGGCQTAPTEFSSLSGPSSGSGNEPVAETQSDEAIVAKLPDVPSNPDVADLDPNQRPELDTVEGGLWMMVQKAERGVNTAGNLIIDPRLNEYVRDVTCRVAGPYCEDIRVYILRVPDFNAAMYPNGMMHIWSGLLLRAENEAQLAAVIGHEIGHYVRRHSLQRFTDVKSKADFLAFFQIGTAVAGVPALGDVAQYVTLASIFSFSRDNEREADAIGARWMASAGYDPAEAAEVWGNLIQEIEATDEGMDRSIFFSSHPPPSARNETLTAFARYMHNREQLEAEAGRERYREIVSSWRTKFLEDEVRVKEPDDALALISVLKDGGIPKGDLLFYEGEIYRQRNDDKSDLKKARGLYEEAMDHGDPPIVIHRSLGLVLMKLDQPVKAEHHFNMYLQNRPDAPDAEMIRFTLKQLET